MQERAWVIGLGRTGTKSLCEAARILGYHNVKHNPPFFEDFLDADFGAEASCQFYFEYLDVRFPGSKFILSTRDLESWLASCQRAINEIYNFSRIPKDSPFYEAMIRNRVARYGTLSYDERVLTETYFKHHHKILSHFKGRSESLLVMNVIRGDGWEKLCPFLAKPVPEALFPSVSDRHE
jgi:hypothetical protein